MKVESSYKRNAGARNWRGWLDRKRMAYFKKYLFSIIGKKESQELFEELNRISLLGMNIGGHSSFEENGEKNVMKYIDQRFSSENGITIFDVGANVGCYSILLNEVFREKAIIYSFEPSHKTFKRISENLRSFERINLYNFGLGEENMKTTLFSDSDESGLASVYKRRLDHFNIHLNQSEEIEIKTLDAFCDHHKIDRIHFLKLDVEGHEIKILNGASKMLNSGSIDFIQFEFGGCNIDSRSYFQDFYNFLNNRYKIYRIVKDGLHRITMYKEIYETFITTNFLAEKR